MDWFERYKFGFIVLFTIAMVYFTRPYIGQRMVNQKVQEDLRLCRSYISRGLLTGVTLDK